MFGATGSLGAVAGRFYRLRALPESASSARAYVQVRMAMYGRPDLLDTAQLVASELVSNAVKATAAGCAHLEMWGGSPVPVIGLSVYPMFNRVVTEVWDCSPEPPRLVEADDDSESGRGLLLVHMLSASLWGYRRPVTGGKVVYATIGAEL
ncbi:ATP-binding protein [Herbidospora sp. RD11066]